MNRDRYLARLTKETIAAHMWNRRWLATYSVCTSRSMEKKEPLTRAIILGRTRLELRAANSGVSWHSLAGDGEEEARETWDREGRDELQGLLLSILMPVPMRSSVKSPRNKRLKILPPILFRQAYYVCRCRSRCRNEVTYSDADFKQIIRLGIAENLRLDKEAWKRERHLIFTTTFMMIASEIKMENSI